MDNYIFDELKKIVGEKNVLLQEPMNRHVTFRTGGKADCFVTVCEPEMVKQTVCFLREQKVNYYIVGNGSNLLFSDRGYHGIVVKMGRYAGDLRIEGHRIVSGAGVLLSQLANAACEAGLTGLEFAAGIPGTVGGAVVMNAGAYGGEIKDIIVSATVLNEYGEIQVLAKNELELSYRHSIIMERTFIILEAEFDLKQGEKSQIRACMDELSKKRREKQPLEYPSAGSTFKRPEGYFAGKLIEDAGLKGFRVGDAQVSEKHSGFVINRGAATTDEILSLVKQVQDIVYEKYGVRLEMEVRVVE
ncbi:MAG: UDP-N-acetylmuramate dehydrogenase [Lachnospiraceae bacterium]|nr:UDP-N-acetylmuramate dehydrogenase [Lachnospiraceae bacterium]